MDVDMGGRKYTTELSQGCLNEHLFTNLLHARTLIETWRREYDAERPKKGARRLTPAAYAKRLAIE
jgi:putative transposase